jgi:hypothetical protein
MDSGVNLNIPSPVDELSDLQQIELVSLLRELSITQIEVVSFSADRLRAGSAPSTQYALTTGVATDSGRLTYRFDAQATLIGEDDEPVALVQIGLVVVFTLPEDSEPQDWIVEHVARNATYMAYPYLRENIQTLSARLGHLGVIMPMAVFGPSAASSIPVDPEA